jgi:hypothetical protein
MVQYASTHISKIAHSPCAPARIEEEEEEGYEEESVDDKELEPDPEFVPGVQSSGYGWGCLLMCLRSCMLTHVC